MVNLVQNMAFNSRSPHGERGLKLVDDNGRVGTCMSLPAWGAWIEIDADLTAITSLCVAPRMGSVD